MSDVTWTLVVLAGVVGLVAGSLATVCVQRWPHGGTVTSPARSTCPSCEAGLRAIDLVPVASWLGLRGRCRSCEASIGLRYPAIELATASGFAATVAVWGAHPTLPALLVLVWSAVVAAAIDVEHRIIPNRLTLRVAPLLAALVVLAAIVEGEPRRLVSAAAYGVGVPLAMFLFSELFRLVRGQVGIGMGDVKLAISIGLVLGYHGGWLVAVFAYAAVLLAVAVALTLLATGRAGLASRIPFGPYLAAGAVLAVVVGPWLQVHLGQRFGV